MTTYTGYAVNGAIPPVTTDTVPTGMFYDGSSYHVIDTVLMTQANPPTDPLGRYTALTMPASPQPLVAGAVGITCHRWPLGATLQPPAPYFKKIRSHDYYVGGKSLQWRDIETSPGVWNWNLFDGWLDNILVLGFEPLFVLNGTPQFYANTTPANVKEPYGVGSAMAPSDMSKWVEFVRQICVRSAGRIKRFQVANEPHDPATWGNQYNNFWADTWENLAIEIRLANRVIKAFYPDALIYGPGTSTMGPASASQTGQAEFTSIYTASAQGYGAGVAIPGTGITDIGNGSGTTAANWVDKVAVHGYSKDRRYGPSHFADINGASNSIRALQASIPGLAGKPIVITEMGCLKGHLLDDEAAGTYICRQMASADWAGVEEHYLYSYDSNADAVNLYYRPVVAEMVAEYLTWRIGKTPLRATSKIGGQTYFVATDGSYKVY